MKRTTPNPRLLCHVRYPDGTIAPAMLTRLSIESGGTMIGGVRVEVINEKTQEK